MLYRIDWLSKIKQECLKCDLESTINKIFQFYENKIKYKDLAQRSSNYKRLLYRETDSYNTVFPFEMLSKVKEMMQVFKSDRNAFFDLIRLAVENWDETHLDYLADFLVNYMFCQPDKANPDMLLLNRLQEIINIDIEYLGSIGDVEKLLENSLTVKIFNNILEHPETIAYIRYIMKEIYDQINIESLESIAFNDLACKTLLQKQNESLMNENNAKKNTRTFVGKINKNLGELTLYLDSVLTNSNLEEHNTSLADELNFTVINGMNIPIVKAEPYERKGVRK